MENYRLPDESRVYEIHMGALSCMRHRGKEFYELQQQHKLAFLIMDEVDFVTGAYIDEIKQAAHEVFEKYHPKAIRISAGCQGALLSTDYDAMERELSQELGITVIVDRNCHLLGYRGRKGGHGKHGDRGAGGRDHRDRRGGRSDWYGDHGGLDRDRRREERKR